MTHWSYLPFLLVWALPVIVVQWLVGGRYLWRERGLWPWIVLGLLHRLFACRCGRDKSRYLAFRYHIAGGAVAWTRTNLKRGFILPVNGHNDRTRLCNSHGDAV